MTHFKLFEKMIFKMILVISIFTTSGFYMRTVYTVQTQDFVCLKSNYKGFER